jgi:hypothetical protein
LGISLYPLQAEALMGMASNTLVTLACGRRSGKSLTTGIWAAYDATMRDLTRHQRRGEPRYILLVAASLTQTRGLFRTIVDLFKAPMLAPLVIEATMDEATWGHRVIIISSTYEGYKGTVEANVYQKTVDCPDEWSNGYHVMVDSEELETVRWYQVTAGY